MLQQASTKTTTTAKKLTITLGETRPGFESQVLGVDVDDQYVYATHYYNRIGSPHESTEPGRLFVLNKSDLSKVAQVEVGYQPRKVAINPGRQRAYVTNYGQKSYSLSIVDLSSHTEIAQLKLGQVPIDVAVNTKTNRVYVTNPFQRKVHVISGETNTEIMFVDVGFGPVAITVDESTGLVYVACSFRSAEPHISSVVVIDGSTDNHKILTTLQIEPDGAQPVNVCVDGNHIYVGCLGGGNVRPIIAVFKRNGTTFTRLPDYPAQAGVTALDVSPQVNLLYAATAGALQVFRTDTNSEVALIRVGRSLQGVVVDHSTGEACVAHAFEGAISRVIPVPEGATINLREDLGLVDKPIKVSEGVWFLGKGIDPNQVRLVKPNNIRAADTTNTDQLWPGGALGLALDGNGLTVGVWEAGDDWNIRDTHLELTGRVNIVETGGNFSDHATHVAGTIAAAGVDSRARGMANQINIDGYSAKNDIEEMSKAAASIVASNHSYSNFTGWGIGDVDPINGPNVTGADLWYGDYNTSAAEDKDFGKYSAQTRDLDDVLYKNPNLLSVWSAGNDRNDRFTNQLGSNRYIVRFSSDPNIPGFTWIGEGWYDVQSNIVPLPGGGGDGNQGTGYDSLSEDQTAKNTVVVGAINDITNDPYTDQDVVISGFSSWGPTDDGRIKPDVVANGVGLFSSLASSDTDYSFADLGLPENQKKWSGTSMAAPNVTGTAALLIQHFQNLFNVAPRSATTKGLLIHTAFDATTNPDPSGDPLIGPDYVYGWGVVDAAAAANFLTNAANSNSSYIFEERLYTGAEQIIEVSLDGNNPLKATIVWTDPPGPLQSDALDDKKRVLVNDLDLWISGPDGTTYYPWTLDPDNPGSPAKQDKANHVDNVEQVFIPAPVAGTYQIHIGHSGGTFKQPYSLFVGKAPEEGYHEGGNDWGDDRYTTSIAFGHVDNDRKAEVGIARRSDTGPRFFILDDKATNFHLLHSGGEDWGDGRYATCIAFGDIDGDGRDEVGITRKSDTGPRYFILDDAENNFKFLHSGGEDWGDDRYGTCITFGDIDGDGLAEIGITRKSNTGPRFFILDDAEHNFKLLHSGGEGWGSGRYATSIAFGDIDDDKIAEIGIARRSDTGPRFYILDDANHNFELLHAGGEGWGSGRHANAIAFGDVDGDNIAEIGVARDSDTGPRYYILDDAKNNFQLLHSGGENWGSGRHATSIAFGDIDGDGKDEVGVGRYSDTGPRYFIQDDKDANFAFIRDGGGGWGDGRYTTSIAFGNIDLDGLAEIGLGRKSDTGPRYFILG